MSTRWLGYPFFLKSMRVKTGRSESCPTLALPRPLTLGMSLTFLSSILLLWELAEQPAFKAPFQSIKLRKVSSTLHTFKEGEQQMSFIIMGLHMIIVGFPPAAKASPK